MKLIGDENAKSFFAYIEASERVWHLTRIHPSEYGQRYGTPQPAFSMPLTQKDFERFVRRMQKMLLVDWAELTAEEVYRRILRSHRFFENVKAFEDRRTSLQRYHLGIPRSKSTKIFPCYIAYNNFCEHQIFNEDIAIFDTMEEASKVEENFLNAYATHALVIESNGKATRRSIENEISFLRRVKGDPSYKEIWSEISSPLYQNQPLRASSFISPLGPEEDDNFSWSDQ